MHLTIITINKRRTLKINGIDVAMKYPKQRKVYLAIIIVNDFFEYINIYDYI